MADRVTAAYRDRLARIRASVERQLVARYRGVDPDAINDSLDAYIAQMAPLIAAGQASAATLTAGFIRSRVLERRGELVDLEDDDDIPGTTKAGEPLATGMAAFGPMILAQIAKGEPLEKAMEYGKYVVTRFADNEVTGAADRQIERQAERTHVIGWEGIVSPDACDGCQANAGEHGFEDEIYRHPGCGCTKVPLLG